MDWLQPAESSVSLGAYVVAAVTAVMLIGVSKGGFGSGLGMLSVPVMMMAMPGHGQTVLPLMLPVLIWCDILAIRQYPSQYSRTAIWRVAPGALCGLFIGWGLLFWLSDPSRSALKDRNDALLKLVVGVLCLAFVGLWAVGRWLGHRSEERPAWQPTWLGGTLAGLPSGVTTMLAHAAGPVFTMYLLPQKLDRREFVGTTVRYFFVFNLLKIPLFMTLPQAAQLTWPVFKATLWMLALAPAAVWLGRWLNERLSPRWFNIMLYLFLGLAGVQLLWGAGTVLVPLIAK